MFDYTLLHWTTFFTAALLLNIFPGPDIALSWPNPCAAARLSQPAESGGACHIASLGRLIDGLASPQGVREQFS